ncbi:MAG: glycoside hydrolase family 3 C-terminal domain-containing protein [Solobacterium sp.]|nr:glycoside hydrolase family 3 C-terminal domain-containing protein [Solobacterium sp.]
MFEYESQHLDLVRTTAGECTVLLKSDGHFPLSKPGRIALYGNGIRYTIKGGTGSGEVNSRFTVNIEEGIKNAGFEITTYAWLDSYDKVREQAKKAFIRGLRAEAKRSHENPILYTLGRILPEPEYNLPLNCDCDTAVYVVSRESGEGMDRTPVKGDVKLTDTEIRDILTLDRSCENFMLVLNTGGVVDLSPVRDVRNILVLSQLGVVNGDVLADLLLGRQYPSGKLTATWSAWEDYCTIGSFGETDDTLYKEGIYVGYRYFDTAGKKPLFPFGYGLSYTTFSVTPVSVTADRNIITADVCVTNTGNYAGKEVVQVYVSAPTGELDKPYQDLAGYAKTKELKPGESETVSVSFALDDLSSYDAHTESYILEKGTYLVRVGNSSDNTVIAAAVTLNETVTVLQAGNVLGNCGFEDHRFTVERKEEIPETACHLNVKAEDIPTRAVSYDRDSTKDPFVQSLSDEELALLNVGAHDPNAKGFMSIIGNAAIHIAGGAGETANALHEKGITYLTMSDGPAGLRLAKEYFEDEKGSHAINQTMIPASMLDNMSKPMRFLIGVLGLNGARAPRHAEVKYQYATMIPVATAVAQSWNDSLAEQYGDIVADEMERFGVNLWLAPAMNIHRSALCGRNFEYYSEDPLISGKMAAAITRGVQKHPGCSVTIKHYAANNQENNRYANNSCVSERALREIYLRGFGICVREGSPHTFMTSYNLLNGIHTSEHRGLIEDVLRSEYRFDGVVMTDWLIAGTVKKGSKYRAADAGEIAMAGGDLVMPGSRADYDKVLAKIRESKENRLQAEQNAERLIRLVRTLKQ